MMIMPTIAQIVKQAASGLNTHSESPRLDAELLLGKVLGLSRAALIARGNEVLAADAELQLAGLLSRRAHGVPLAYLTGSREFWSLPLAVTPDVLVPRPETECLVQQALMLDLGDECSVVDLGTGSGAIALSLATERPRWRITGVDLSAPAIAVAARNARALNLPQVAWRLGSWLDAVPGERFDLIVANPPYIAGSDPALLTLKSEPAMALTCGPTGLESLALIIAQAPNHLNAEGWLVLEHGSTQASAVAELMQQHDFRAVRTFPDFSGKPRITLGLHSTLGIL
jgi:release factor glutamine methyltransferase